MTTPATAPLFPFDNSYARELAGFYVEVSPDPAPEPTLLRLNRTLAEELGLDPDLLDSPLGARIFAADFLRNWAMGERY